MSEKDDLLNNDDNKKPKPKRQTKKKPTEDLKSLEEQNQDLIQESDSEAQDLNLDLNNDEVINVELYNEVLSTLFNSLNNPIVRNEIKVNEDILKYLELQISNLFFLETALSKKLTGKKMAKEFLQLTANLLDLSLTVNKSPKKTRIEILEDRNLLIVTIVNSCKGVERESLERIRVVDSEALQNLNNQIAALSNFTTENTNNNLQEDNVFNQDNQLQSSQNNNQNMNNQNLNNPNFGNFNNQNMADLSNLGLLPKHPASNPKFYPYLTKPTVIPKIKKVLAGLLLFSTILAIIVLVLASLVKGPLFPYLDEEKNPVNFVLGQTNSLLMSIMTLVIYCSFAYMFIKPAKIKTREVSFILFHVRFIVFWLVVTIGYSFYQITDKYYQTLFSGLGKREDLIPIEDIVAQFKALPNYQLFRIFTIISVTFNIVPLILILVLMLINPRVDRNKVMKANLEYQKAMSAVLSGQKYEMDPSLFDNDDESDEKKRKKANFSGRF